MAESIRRCGAALAAAVVALALATACTPEPTPSPTPSATGFASEEEAFAAAEATYRAYVDAVNQVDLSDPATFEPVFDQLTGDALASAKQSFSEMHADEWVVGGSSVISVVSPTSSSQGDVLLAVCLDVSSVTLIDSDGSSQVGDRPTEQALTVTVHDFDEDWRITQFAGRDGEPTCEP